MGDSSERFGLTRLFSIVAASPSYSASYHPQCCYSRLSILNVNSFLSASGGSFLWRHLRSCLSVRNRDEQRTRLERAKPNSGPTRRALHGKRQAIPRRRARQHRDDAHSKPHHGRARPRAVRLSAVAQLALLYAAARCAALA